MSPKWNYIFGATTITLIVGGTVYAIVKSNQVKKSEEEGMSLSEARELVAQGPGEEREAEIAQRDALWKKSMDSEYTKTMRGVKTVNISNPAYEGLMDGLTNPDEKLKEKIIQAVKVSSLVDDENEEEDEVDSDDPLYDKYERVNEYTQGPSIEPLKDFSYYEEGIDPKEDKTLRYEPNSVEAKHQFIRMELADWDPGHDVYRIMLQLFEFAFIPTNDGDEILRTQIIDYKVQFFGFKSRWNREISFADVILHYARGAEFNCGETVKYWVEYFLEFNEFEWDSTSNHMDTLILRLNSHTYFNDERQTFGLFGLTREGMDQAIRISNRNIDRSVTYEIEFNEFLKSCI